MSTQTVPSVDELVAAHAQAKAAVCAAADRIRARHTGPDERAAALDRWLRGDLAGAFAWGHGIAAAYVIGLSDGLAEVGQP